MPRYWLGRARNFIHHIFVSTQTVISVSRIRCNVKLWFIFLYNRYNVVISHVFVTWRHYNDSTDIFRLACNSSLPGGAWVSGIVKNVLNIATRYGVYSLLSFCNVSCPYVNNFIWFSGKTLFSCHLLFCLFWRVQISFHFITNCCFFACSSLYEV